MKSLVLLLILLSSFFQLFGQTKNFNGAYPLSGNFFWVEGKANYNYTEAADYSRIKNGSFSFTSNMSGKQLPNFPNGSFTQSVKGNYKNNVKDGLWTNTMVIKNMANNSGTVSAQANYKNGVPHGNWLLTATNGGSSAIIESYSLNFKNGIVIGKFETHHKTKKTTVSGFCNDEGFLHGKMIIFENNTEIIQEYDNGILKSKTTRNTATGEIIARKESAAEDIEMAKKLQLLAKTNPSELDNMPFRLETEHSPQSQAIFSDGFKIGLLPDDFGGDSSYFKNYNRFEWEAFRYVVLVEQETRAQKEAKIKLEAERQQKLEAERLERERKAEAEKLERERKAEAERLERERQAAEQKIARERQAAEQAAQNELYELSRKDLANQEKIKALYLTTTTIPLPMVGAVRKPKVRKPKIYDAYTTLSEAHRKTIADTSDLNEKLAASKKLIALQEKIIRLADQNTKDIEKQLKKATDASQIESILGL